MSDSADVAVIGAGLAGLASAILLARRGFTVTLLEQHTLPKHRVCGEYISREALPFLERLGFVPSQHDAKWIDRFELTTLGGRRFETRLRLGGFGLSRYAFDFALLQLALQAGVQIAQDCSVKSLTQQGHSQTLHTSRGSYTARVVLGCFGKRSGLDNTLQRPHAKTRSEYVGVKRHFRGSFPGNVVSLHAIPGGYCGISAIEQDRVNVCYLTTTTAIEQCGGLRSFDTTGIRLNARLAAHLDGLTPEFDKPLVISQLHFGTKTTDHSEVLMLGDAALLLHPLAGNGMAMALRAADLAVPRVEAFLRGKTSRATLASSYARAWHDEVRVRRQVSRLLQRAFESDKLNETLCRAACAWPSFARAVIERTHGRPF